MQQGGDEGDHEQEVEDIGGDDPIAHEQEREKGHGEEGEHDPSSVPHLLTVGDAVGGEDLASDDDEPQESPSPAKKSLQQLDDGVRVEQDLRELEGLRLPGVVPPL